MSDPVSNVEIEDVLASIRRLVAEGDTPKRGPAKVDQRRVVTTRTRTRTLTSTIRTLTRCFCLSSFLYSFPSRLFLKAISSRPVFGRNVDNL